MKAFEKTHITNCSEEHLSPNPRFLCKKCCRLARDWFSFPVFASVTSENFLNVCYKYFEFCPVNLILYKPGFNTKMEAATFLVASWFVSHLDDCHRHEGGV